MFADSFYQTQNGEIFLATRCMQHEQVVHNFFSSMLNHLGYHQSDNLKRQWTRSQKQNFYHVRHEAVVSFADSFGLCGNRNLDPAQWFSKNTVVITDNHALFKPEYTICQTPSSYFGIFNYVPKDQEFRPQRRFGLSVNRFDNQRQLILLELLRQSDGIDIVLEKDYVNFNVRDPSCHYHSVLGVQETFASTWDKNLISAPVYQPYYDQAFDAVPIRNHDLTVEQTHVSAFLTLVIETYADDAVIALSEKIFRALVTPAPWTVYAAPNTVKYIKSLGFDVLDDLIDHSYDTELHYFSSDGNKKTINYIANSFANYENLRQQSTSQLATRCLQAAKHNQAVLRHMQNHWPKDFASWLPAVIAALQ